MGHAIGGGFLNAKTKDAAMKEGYANAVEFACYNVDRCENPSGDYYNSFRFYDRTFNSEEEAYRFFDSLGYYMDGVCKVKETPKSAWTKYQKTRQSITKKERALYDSARKSFEARTSATVGCKKCGCRIKKDVALNFDLHCPSCRNWLVPDSVKKKMSSLFQAEEEAKAQLRKDTADKGKARYWAKYEVHC